MSTMCQSQAMLKRHKGARVAIVRVAADVKWLIKSPAAVGTWFKIK